MNAIIENVKNILGFSKNQKLKIDEKTEEKASEKKQLSKLEIYKKLLPYVIGSLHFVIIQQLIASINTYLSVLQPTQQKNFLDATVEGDFDKLSKAVVSWIEIEIILIFTSPISQFIQQQFSAKIEEKFDIEIFKKVTYADHEFYKSKQPHEISNIFQGQTYYIQYLLSGEQFFSPFQNIIRQMGLVKNLYHISPMILLCLSITIPINYFKMQYDIKKSKILNKLYQNSYESTAYTLTYCWYNSIDTMKSCTSEKIIQESFAKFNEGGGIAVRQPFDFMQSFLNKFIQMFDTFIVIFVGYYLLFVDTESKFTVGDFCAFMTNKNSVQQLFEAFKQIKLLFLPEQNQDHEYKQVEEIFKALEYKPTIRHDTGEEVKNVEGNIEFKDVSFKYPGTNEIILKNLNFKINSGDYVALVGQIGCGKSTLIQLILRFYNATTGVVKIDDKHINDLNVISLRKHISVVRQAPFLFNTTIKKNITFGMENEETLDDKEIELACKMAGAEEFYNDKLRFPDGLHTQVGYQGSKLSGGQLQRVAIARALIRKPKIMIFDEATSALDSQTEHVIQQSIDNIVNFGGQNITRIVIAHRYSTISNCNKILVIKDGTVVEQGSHKELRDKKGEYWNLLQHQLNIANAMNIQALAGSNHTPEELEKLKNREMKKKLYKQMSKLFKNPTDFTQGLKSSEEPELQINLKKQESFKFEDQLFDQLILSKHHTTYY